MSRRSTHCSRPAESDGCFSTKDFSFRSKRLRNTTRRKRIHFQKRISGWRPRKGGFPFIFLRTLQRQGYYAEELRLIARHEEMLIDGILTQDDLAYLDDDVE